MKIAFLVFWGIDSEGGVSKKIVSQIRAWQTQGREVCLFGMSLTGNVWDGFAGIPMEIETGRSRMRRFLRGPILMKRVLRWAPDIVYLRWGSNFPYLCTLLEKVPTVFELNTNDVAEIKAIAPRVNYYYHLLTRGRILRRVSGLVAVTNEIARSFVNFHKPILVLGNGFDLSSVVPLKAPCNPTPRLVFCGTAGLPWHGTDKILWLAESFPECNFDFIGPSRKDLQTVHVPRNVSIHGFLSGLEYRDILACADVALGSLALHRVGIAEACTLKVREHLAFGIPTIIGYKETDFPDPPSFLLELSCAKDNVSSNLDRIRQFVYESRGKRVSREAIQHLSVVFKEKKRLEFFKQVLAQKTSFAAPLMK